LTPKPAVEKEANVGFAEKVSEVFLVIWIVNAADTVSHKFSVWFQNYCKSKISPGSFKLGSQRFQKKPLSVFLLTRTLRRNKFRHIGVDQSE